MGPNGSGKTTLLRILLGGEQPDSGTVHRGHHVDVGYFDQHLQTLDPAKEAIRAVWPDDPTIIEQQMRDLLGRFGLTGDQVYQKVASLSGGERSRAALAKLVALNVNVLVLDEPTNHLDIWACESLEEALRAFDGTAILVSHDRYFLNRVVDLLIVLDGQGGARVIHGNYETYERMALPATTEAKPRAETEEARAAPPPKTAKRKRRFPYRKIEELEAEIAQVEEQQRQLGEQLASPDLYRDGEKVKQATQAFEETKTRLAQLYEHWEEAVELNQR
jgi:ATP-binding cassette subfamily F protein 3